MNVAYKIALAVTAVVCGAIILWDLQQTDAGAAQSARAAVKTAPPAEPRTPATPPPAAAPPETRGALAAAPKTPATMFHVEHVSPGDERRSSDRAAAPRATPGFPPPPVNRVEDTPASPRLNVPISSATDGRTGGQEVSTIAAIAQPRPQAPQPVQRSGGQTGGEELGSFFTPSTDGSVDRVAAEHLPESYTVQPGDSYSTIARRVYGKERMWVAIRDANPGVDPRKLVAGQSIRLPQPGGRTGSSAPATAPSQPSASPAGVRSHTVQRGDTLSDIAKAVYRDAGQWRKIYEANRATIGGDPDRLPLGAVLRIP